MNQRSNGLHCAGFVAVLWLCDGISDELYAAVSSHFDERALTLLTLQVVMINGWNRLNIAFRTLPGSKDRAYGLTGSGLE